MRMILQRVSSASVRVEGEVVGRIGRGMLVLTGIEKKDPPEKVEAAVRKLIGLRIFEDAQGRMNLDSQAAGGAFLIVSQFTLAASLNRGRRPSFEGAAHPEVAEPMIEHLVARLREEGFEVATGRFGAHMDVELVNDGPVTFVLEL